MTTYAPPLIVACPNCGAPQAILLMSSGNTFGSTLWSDGYLHAPMLPADPPFRVCTECAGFFVDVEAGEIGRLSRGNDFGEDVSDLPDGLTAMPEFARDPDEAQCHAALQAGFPQARGRETRVRIHAWHLHNHRDRKGVPGAGPLLPEWVENARALLGLLDESDPQEGLMAAELHRQLGGFDEARRVLGLIGDAELRPFVDAIRDAADRGLQQVVPLRAS